jgi:hypothetical protein
MFLLRTLRRAGGAAMLLLSFGCQTNPVLIINPYAGIEGSGAHCLRMRFGRLVPDYETGVSTADHSVTYRLGEKSIQGERQVVSVKLPFTAVNDTDAPWVVDSSMFELERTSDHEKFVREGSSFSIALLPPRSNNRFDVLFRVEAPLTFDKNKLTTCSYRLDVVERAGSERLLQKELSLAEMSQPTQLARLAVVVVGAIVLIGVL